MIHSYIDRKLPSSIQIKRDLNVIYIINRTNLATTETCNDIKKPKNNFQLRRVYFILLNFKVHTTVWVAGKLAL